MSYTEPEIRESYAQMSEWQKAIWDDLIYESSDYTAQEACINFLKKIFSMDIREDHAYKKACASNEIASNQYRIDKQAALNAKQKSNEDYIKKLKEAFTKLKTQLSTSMRNFLQAHGIDAKFANTLYKSRNVISDVHDLPQYIAKMQYQVENRVDILNVTPLERRLWNLLVTTQTPPESQQAIQEFIKIALNAMGFDTELYENTYDDTLKPPDLNYKSTQTAFYRNDLNASMSNKPAFVEVYMFVGNNRYKYVTTNVYWAYNREKNKFELYYAGMNRGVPLSSLTEKTEKFRWVIQS